MGKYRLIFLILCFICSSCSTSYTDQVVSDSLTFLNFKENHRVVRSEKWVLNSNTSMFITAPEIFNGQQDKIKLPVTQFEIHHAFLNAFSRGFSNIQSSEEVWAHGAALMLAQEARAQILLIPSLQYVVNNLGTLPLEEAKQIDKPARIYPLDTAVVKVSIYDVASGQLIDVVRINSQAKFYKSRNYSLAKLVNHAALYFTSELCGRDLAPFG